MKYIQGQFAQRAPQGQFLNLAVQAIYRLFGNMFGLFKPQKPVELSVSNAREVSYADFSSIQLDPNQAVFFRPKDVVTLPSSRVITVTIEGAKGVSVGRIWLYLYRKERKVRRVFRIEDEQIRAILGTKNRYYMTDLPWKVEDGDAELSRIRHQSASDVERLIVTTHNERMAKKSGGRTPCEFQGQMKIAPEPVEKVVPVQAPAPVAPPAPPAPVAQPATVAPEASVVPVKLVQSAPAEAVAASVVRPVAGRSYIGVISEMGKTTRQGSDGPYQAFCVKLEDNGVHMPLYGVELEREIIERKARPGDKVKIVLMQRQPIEGQGPSKWKNLYKVEVLQKGVK